MILSGRKILEEIKVGNIEISDFDISRLNPNSYNLRLHNELLMYNRYELDMKKENKAHLENISEDGYRLVPGKLYLGRTEERTYTDKFVPMLEGRSSIGRLGIFIHATAGFGDVGFEGFWTLEISCVQPVTIYPDVEICQIYYHTIDGEYDKYESGKYQRNTGIQPSLLFTEFSDRSRPKGKKP